MLQNPGHILVVDDLPENVDVLCRRLDRNGYTYDIAASGQIGLEMISRQDFDLILLDIMMPVMDGFDFLKKLRTNPDTRDLPVIVILARGEMERAVECIQLGADDYLAKPFNSVILQARVANSIQKYQFRRQALELAASEERNRLARDLHDAVSQTIFAASLLSEVIPGIWEQDQVEGRRRLQELRELTRGAQAEMRALLIELRPRALVETELTTLLRQIANAVMGRGRIPVELTIEGNQTQVPTDVKIAMYRVAQEGLNNAIKHSRATQAKIFLQYEPTTVQMTVSDNGNGFVVEDALRERFGLGIMSERAVEVGATLTVQSQPGSGVRIVFRWDRDPIQEQAIDHNG